MRKSIKLFTIMTVLSLFVSSVFAQNYWKQGSSFGMFSWYFPADKGIKFVAGDFDGDGEEEVFAYNTLTGNSSLHKYRVSTDPFIAPHLKWDYLWHNAGYVIDYFNYVSFKNDSKFVAGDFDGDGKDELLLISPSTGKAELLKYKVVDVVTKLGRFERIFPFDHSIGGISGLASIKSTDNLVVGKFGSSYDNHLCVHSNDGKIQVFYYNKYNAVFQQIYSSETDNLNMFYNGKNYSLNSSKLIGKGSFLNWGGDQLVLFDGSNKIMIFYIDRMYSGRLVFELNYVIDIQDYFGLDNIWTINTKEFVVGNFDGSTTRDEILMIKNQYANLIQTDEQKSYLEFSSIWNNGTTGYLCGNVIPTDMRIYSGINYCPIKALGNKTYILYHNYRNNSSEDQYFMLDFVKTNGRGIVGLTSPANKSTQVIGNDEQAEVSYSVYPNPATDYVNINRTVGDNQSVYQLYDVLGKKVQEGILQEGILNQQIELSGLKTGTYLLRIIDGEKIITERLLVK